MKREHFFMFLTHIGRCLIIICVRIGRLFEDV
jgi:hypothetical protein